MYEPQEVEKRILDFWEKNKIFEKSMKLRKGKKSFSFLDGPPTANNPMGVHHAWGRTYKDLFLRLKTMQGFDTRKQPGFDCQGLWVEVGIEKELGFKSKKDIEEYGIAQFTQKCVDSVLNYVKLWVALSKKLGMFMDWDDPYLTMSDKNIEYVWYFLKKCHERGWLYKGEKSLPWCPRCGTSLSSHEVSSGYEVKKHPGIYVKFKVKDKENEYLLIFTTTPWTLASNVAVAVHPNFEYCRVRVDDDILIIGKDLVKQVLAGKEYRVLGDVFGRELVELQYNNPLKELVPLQWEIQPRVILSEEFVSMEEGTGLVHIAPGHGPEDYELGKQYNLPFPSPVNEDGIFEADAGFLQGKNVHEANETVTEKLKEMNVLLKQITVTHNYPCCWRCHEELIFRLGKEWFIGSEEVKPKLIEEAAKVRWYPEWNGKSMKDWLTNLKDWNISRKRYFGLPLPFWECECGHVEVIGSLEELKKRAVKGMDKLKELHRPWIDGVIINCPKCGKEVRRIEETGDCWLDAGVVPFSTLKYLEDKNYWKNWFPADFITEMHEQVRLWFYSMLFISTTIENKTPYKSVLAHGMVLDENRREMHKSWGNVIWADEALEKIGADIMRWMYCTQNPGSPIAFGYTPAKEVRRILNVLYNTSKFLETYLEASSMKPSEPKKPDTASKWLLSRLQTLKQEVNSSMDELKPHVASKALQDFFLNDLSRWYGQIIREDIKPDVDSENKETILNTFYKVMLETLKLLAPFIPFLTEQLYQDFFRKFEKEESIHLADWPKVEKSHLDKKLEERMEVAKKIVEASNSIRHDKGIRLKYQLKELVIDVGENDKAIIAVKNLKEIIAKMANVIDVKIRDAEEGKEVDGMKIHLETEVTPELKEKWLISELTRKIQMSRKKLGFKIKNRIKLFLEDDLFKEHKDQIEKSTGSKITFGKLEGDEFQLVFENKKYKFGLKA